MGGFCSDQTAYARMALILKRMGYDDLIAMQTHIDTTEAGHPDTEYQQLGLEGLVNSDEFYDALVAEIESRSPHIISC